MQAELARITMPRQHGPLIAIQELDGKTLYVDDTSFARAGFATQDIIGVPWQEFVAPEEREAELAVVANVLRSGLPAYPLVVRRWPSRTVKAVNKTSLITSKGGVQLIMREGHIIDPASGPPIDLLLDAQGPLAQLDALQSIARSLIEARGLAQREAWDLLRYLIDMARLQADKQRTEIQKSILN